MDLRDGADPMASMGRAASPYMKDFAEKLAFVKSEVFALYSIPEIVREWCVSLCPPSARANSDYDAVRVKDISKYVITTFLLHASIAKPLGEMGKLQLTSDMTECEFALSAFMAEPGTKKRGVDWESIGDEYRALRAMRCVSFPRSIPCTHPHDICKDKSSSLITHSWPRPSTPPAYRPCSYCITSSCARHSRCRTRCMAGPKPSMCAG